MAAYAASLCVHRRDFIFTLVLNLAFILACCCHFIYCTDVVNVPDIIEANDLNPGPLIVEVASSDGAGVEDDVGDALGQLQEDLSVVNVAQGTSDDAEPGPTVAELLLKIEALESELAMVRQGRVALVFSKYGLSLESLNHITLGTLMNAIITIYRTPVHLARCHVKNFSDFEARVLQHVRVAKGHWNTVSIWLSEYRRFLMQRLLQGVSGFLDAWRQRISGYYSVHLESWSALGNFIGENRSCPNPPYVDPGRDVFGWIYHVFATCFLGRWYCNIKTLALGYDRHVYDGLASPLLTLLVGYKWLHVTLCKVVIALLVNSLWLLSLCCQEVSENYKEVIYDKALVLFKSCDSQLEVWMLPRLLTKCFEIGRYSLALSLSHLVDVKAPVSAYIPQDLDHACIWLFGLLVLVYLQLFAIHSMMRSLWLLLIKGKRRRILVATSSGLHGKRAGAAGLGGVAIGGAAMPRRHTGLAALYQDSFIKCALESMKHKPRHAGAAAVASGGVAGVGAGAGGATPSGGGPNATFGVNVNGTLNGLGSRGERLNASMQQDASGHQHNNSNWQHYQHGHSSANTGSFKNSSNRSSMEYSRLNSESKRSNAKVAVAKS